MAQMAFTLRSMRTRRARDACRTRRHCGAGDLTRGRQLYAAHCATCHGPRGEGDGPGCCRALAGAHESCRTRLRPRADCRRAVERRGGDGDAGMARCTLRTIWRRSSAAVRGTQHGSTGARAARRAAANSGSVRIRTTACSAMANAATAAARRRQSLAMAPTDLTRQRPTLAMTTRDAARRHPRHPNGALDLPTDERRAHRGRPVRAHASTTDLTGRSGSMIADVVVLASVVLTAAFVAAWLVSPAPSGVD